MKSYLVYIFEKNAKMDQTMIDILTPLQTKVLEEDQKAYYGNIKGIVDHILSGNIFMLGLLAKTFPDTPIEIPEIRENLSFPDLAQTLLKIDQSFIDFTKHLSPQEELRTLTFFGHTITVSELLLKCYVHGTHHRGQVSQILDSLGIENNWSILS